MVKVLFYAYATGVFSSRGDCAQFNLRQLAKVRSEWDLACLALNAWRLHALMAA